MAVYTDIVEKIHFCETTYEIGVDGDGLVYITGPGCKTVFIPDAARAIAASLVRAAERARADIE